MARLEELVKGATVSGILPTETVTIIDAKWHGNAVIELTYKSTSGALGSDLVYRSHEPNLSVQNADVTWSFDADGWALRLVSEAHRIRLAYLFDPYIAVHTSLIEPLPHQITAVYGEMLSRQPLRFLLADDPGAGKTIMAGLLIKELIIRGDVKRCLVVCPGNLSEQWQDELYEKFNLSFNLINRFSVESSLTGNPFEQHDLAIGRLDHLARNDDLLALLEGSEWDLIICDEAHKMSATFFGNEAKYTKRYRLGRVLSKVTRHFLLMTATPHNGKEADFQLFMSLIDGDRFEGKYRDGVHLADPSDLMRRMIKEKLVRFDGTPLFPERIAKTLNYPLSDEEAALYLSVTDYVREEFNRAENLENERRGTVGFALTVLQRRLASSPEAIFQSLSRRHQRLLDRLEEMKLLKRGMTVNSVADRLPLLTEEDLEDLEDAPDTEVEEMEERVLDQATAAMTIAELEVEIGILERLEKQAKAVLDSGLDRKWEELSGLLHDSPEMFTPERHRRKLVIFTEHKDTLNYLQRRISTMVGPEAVTTIHGGMGRQERKNAEHSFTQDKKVTVLIATDAAGEGINLQRAHLMVNYDLPWNPNRLEQRFGRIHRIGQTEVCHLWNLVANETREGMVWKRLCEKLEQEAIALEGQVFDVLGQAFADSPLRQILIDAIRYGDRPEVRARLTQVIDHALDREHLQNLIEQKALAHDVLDSSKVQQIREEMERVEARRLQPHFIQSFFMEAFKRLGGRLSPRETGRFEITHVPQSIRNRDRQIGTREPLLESYQRVTFRRDKIHVAGKPEAAFICPGHPLLNATVDIILEQHRSLLRQGAVMVDPRDPTEVPRVLFYLEHSIRDARGDGQVPHVISREMQFIEIDLGGRECRRAGLAPYLDYRPVEPDEKSLIQAELSSTTDGVSLEQQVLGYAIEQVVPQHFDSIKARNEERIAKTMSAVKERLTKEITYWDHRTQELKLQEEAGKKTRLPWMQAKRRVEQLEGRLQSRMEELQRERQISPLPPVVIGGALVIPNGLLARLKGERQEEPSLFARETKRTELAAMAAVMKAEKDLGFEPRDVSSENLGYDIESKDPESGHLRFIEVKGRLQGSTTVTVTRNEILASFNQPERFILALVMVPPSDEAPSTDPYSVAESGDAFGNGTVPGCTLRYVRHPFDSEPDFGVVSINFSLNKLWEHGGAPS